MLELSAAQIGTWVATFILPLFRVAAVLMTMPVFGTRMLPARIRLYVALAITVVPVIAIATPLCNRWRTVGLYDTWLGLILPNLSNSLPLSV